MYVLLRIVRNVHGDQLRNMIILCVNAVLAWQLKVKSFKVLILIFAIGHGLLLDACVGILSNQMQTQQLSYVPL